MGQAKQRGSYKQRKQAAVERKAAEPVVARPKPSPKSLTLYSLLAAMSGSQL